MTTSIPNMVFAKHKGYPTKAHLEAMEKYGVPPFYRKKAMDRSPA